MFTLVISVGIHFIYTLLVGVFVNVHTNPDEFPLVNSKVIDSLNIIIMTLWSAFTGAVAITTLFIFVGVTPEQYPKVNKIATDVAMAVYFLAPYIILKSDN